MYCIEYMQDLKIDGEVTGGQTVEQIIERHNDWLEIFTFMIAFILLVLTFISKHEL